MDWIIERIDATEQAVYLRKLSSGTRRRICVPGAIRAGWQAELLFIEARTGFVWLVEPQTGRRRRRQRSSCCFLA